jgi:hypothetical protein
MFEVERFACLQLCPNVKKHSAADGRNPKKTSTQKADEKGACHADAGAFYRLDQKQMLLPHAGSA